MVLLVSILSSIYCYLIINKFDELTDNNFNIIFKNIQFEYGKLIHNIYYNFDYSFIDDDGIIYYLKRLPLHPLLLVSIAKISKNIFFIFIFKNIILFSLLFISVLVALRSQKIKVFVLFLLFLPFIIPYNLHVILSIFFADNIVAVLMPSIFILLYSNNKKKYFLISIFIFLLYLTKNSVMFVVYILPLLIILLEKDRLILKSLPLFGAISAIFLWGIFGIINTSKFPIGSSVLTSNSKVLNEVVLNEKFKEFYPERSVDLINKNQIPDHLKSEWEVYEYYKIENKIYLSKNFFEFVSDIKIKLKFIFFNIKKDSVFPINGKYENPIMISHIINKIFFNLSIIIFFIFFVKNFKKNFDFRAQKNDLYFINILLFSLFPNIIGWATSKHLVSIQIISIIYILFKFNFYNNNKFILKFN
ncbi:hypothetical protein ACIJYB_00970 [Candidatus Pelagibacter bacterium nBUS_44]|uniref:hypothetical protein n=1 Tax=Candidatus Pelagibacter bacterium nBUS_44 TaxID=3374195 RepID=UPI003EC0A334